MNRATAYSFLAIIVFLIWAMFGQPAHSQRYTCEDVRDFVGRYGRTIALAIARSKGMTASEEKRARACFVRRVRGRR